MTGGPLCAAIIVLPPPLRLLFPIPLVGQRQAAALAVLGDLHPRPRLLLQHLAAHRAVEPFVHPAEVPVPALALEVPPDGGRVEHLPVPAARTGELEVQMVRPHVPEVGYGVRRAVDEHLKSTL